jgi:hypothetical protein
VQNLSSTFTFALKQTDTRRVKNLLFMDDGHLKAYRGQWKARNYSYPELWNHTSLETSPVKYSPQSGSAFCSWGPNSVAGARGMCTILNKLFPLNHAFSSHNDFSMLHPNRDFTEGGGIHLQVPTLTSQKSSEWALIHS